MPVPHKRQEECDGQSRIYKLCLERRYSLGWFVQRLLSRFIPYWDCSWAYDWKRLHRLCADFDIVVARQIRIAAAFRLWDLAPLYIDGDDIHTLEFDLHTKEIGGSLVRRVQRFLLARFQDRMYRVAQKIWVPVRDHVDLLPQYSLSYLPNLPRDDLPDYSKTLGASNTLFFIGLMASSPNYLAVDWFLENYWKQLKIDFPDLRLRIVGGGLPETYAERWGDYHDVEILGRRDDISQFYRNALALLTPMRIGMGSCIKVLESLKIGRPVLSTVQGLRGIDRSHHKFEYGICVFDGYESLSASIAKLQRDVTLRLSAQEQARAFVDTEFSFENFCQLIRKDIVR